MQRTTSYNRRLLYLYFFCFSFLYLKIEKNRTPAVALPTLCSDNRIVPDANMSNTPDPFRPGTMVVVTLGNPREKLWGAILSITAEGLSLCGIELASFDDLVSMVKDGESFSPGVVFFPMHRVERMELDRPDGSIPSLSQRFTAKTGLQAADVLNPSHFAQPRAQMEQR